MITFALIFLCGLVLGVPIGVALDDALDMYREVRKEPRMPKPEQPAQQQAPKRRHHVGSTETWITTGALIGLIVVVLLQAGVGVLLMVTRANTASYEACSAQRDQDWNVAYKARLKLSVEKDEAMDKVVDAVDSKDPKAFKKAVNNYQEVRDRQDANRRNHPLPPLPEKLCGKPAE